jgi:hypothetical protein
MRTDRPTLILCCLLGACGPKLIGNLPGDDSNATTDDGATDGASTSGPATFIGGTSEAGEDATTADATTVEATTADATTADAMTVDATTAEATTTGPDDTTGDTGTSGGPFQGIAPECMMADHATCYPPVIEACGGQNNWDVTPACADAVGQCYPFGSAAVSPIDIINLCTAEIDDDCLTDDAPGCGASVCDCVAGAYPFVWTNCWHLTLVACKYGPNSDCAAVLDMCYPGTTQAEYEACVDQVEEQEWAYQCECAMCSIHEQCEAELAGCLAG